MVKELVFIQNDQALTTSLKVAEVFGKHHRHVLENIRELIRQIEGMPKNGQTSPFQETTYINEQNGQTYPMYLMNRDGFTLLVMGFTGQKALQWKWDYIQAFNKLESELIELLAERKSAEWLEVRKATKRTYRKLTDTIQQVLIPLAREQGAIADDRVFYMSYSKMLNKCAGIKPKSRDDLPVGQLYEVDKMQDMATLSIRGLAAKKSDYHQVYSETKQTLENYSALSFINQRFITA